MIVKPYGMQNSEEHEHLFNPTKPVIINFWGMDKFGFALGFSQCVDSGKYFGGVFSRRIRPPEWRGGNIYFGKLTKKKFIECFLRVYGVVPTIL